MDELENKNVEKTIDNSSHRVLVGEDAKDYGQKLAESMKKS